MKYITLLFILTLSGCAPFKQQQENYQRISAENLSSLHGSYSIFPIRTVENSAFDNANEKFFRKSSRGVRDTIHFDLMSEGKITISVIDDEKISLKYFKRNEIVRSQILGYEIMDDGFLLIKNRNTTVSGLPFIFGGIDAKKVRLALGPNNELIINDVHYSGGGLLLILSDSKRWERTNSFVRIE